MAATLLNTKAALDGKTVMVLETAETITSLKTFNRSPNAPFAVTASSAVVTNLDADKLDGVEGASFLRSDAADTKDTGDLTFNDSIKVTLGTGGDADLYYDGTHVYLNTRVVGTGDFRVLGGGITIPAAAKLYLDGGNNSYIFETSADDVRIVAGGNTAIQCTASLVSLAVAAQLQTLGAFASGDQYLIVDASGNVHKSGLGPAS